MRPIAALMCLVAIGHCAAAAPKPNDAWLGKIRTDHPRLFFNADTWPAVKARALGAEKETFASLKRRVDKYPDNPKGTSGGAAFEREERIAGKTYKMPIAKPAREFGIEAMRTAFVYLVTGERKYLDKAKKMLAESVKVYHECYKQRRAVNWYSTSRVCWLAAYDWLYNDFSADERKGLIVPMLKHVADVQPGRGKPRIYRCNTSNHLTGFYGVRNIVWFAGLAAHKDGLADKQALKLLKEGYTHNMALFAHRAKTAGDDGGLASPTVGYALCAYPWAQFNFLHTWRSATGENLAPEWPHLAYFPIWIMWNWIPAKDRPKEFGMGDTPHFTNNLPWYQIAGHMQQIRHFYGASHPDCAAVAGFVRERCSLKRFASHWSMYPFLMTDADKAPAPTDAGKLKLHARHFEAMGQIIMRSGWGVDDTYAMLTAGSTLRQHKHYDEGNFIIYKKGFLALDTGTRGSSSKDFNLRHYYAQTVAHNSVLIHMPNEPLPSYWGPKYDGPEGKLCHGGMNKQTGSTITALETNDRFTYAAVDLTACYSSKKCKRAVRQFVHLLPDTFVVFDRVVAAKPEYAKQWLLHTQNEPTLDGLALRTDEGGGRLFCRTLLPEDATLAKVGGPHKEFWANGINWEVNDAERKRQEQFRKKHGKGYLWGNWRVEVAPGTPRAADTFLHVLHAADKKAGQMPATELVRKAGQVGVRVQVGDTTLEITFATSGAPAGHVRLVGSGRPAVDRALSTTVQKQSGLGAAK